jgi:flagellar assembly protein FliH
MVVRQSQRLLKAESVRQLGARVAFNFDDLQQEGESYLNRIREQAAAIVQAAQQEAAVAKEQAYREAREAGRRDGLQEAARLIEAEAERLANERLAERVSTALPALSAVAQAMQSELESWLIRWEESAVRTAVAIAEKLVRHELRLRPDTAAEMIRAALQLASGQPQLRIHLNPEDVRHFGSQAEAVVRAATACSEAEVVPDAAVSRGGCRIETRHGEIDARLETMLNRIAEELLS